VTHSQGNVIYEIDGKPSLEVLQEYLPDPALADDWGRYILTCALCFRAPSYMKDEEYTFRTIPSVNKADGSITVQTEVQEGTSVWFSIRDKEKTTTGLDRMAAQIKQQLGDAQPKLVFQFDCTARGKTMFREEEKLGTSGGCGKRSVRRHHGQAFIPPGRSARLASTIVTTTTRRLFSPSADHGRVEGTLGMLGRY
jgi:hypothetical protein